MHNMTVLYPNLCCKIVCYKRNALYSKTCVKRPLSKRQKIGFQDQLSLNVGQKYCRMLQGKHSAILSTFIKLPFVIKIIVLSIFEWPFYTGFTVFSRSILKQPSVRECLFRLISAKVYDWLLLLLALATLNPDLSCFPNSVVPLISQMIRVHSIFSS